MSTLIVGTKRNISEIDLVSLDFVQTDEALSVVREKLESDLYIGERTRLPIDKLMEMFTVYM